MLEQIIAKKRELIKTLPAQFERQEKLTRGFYQALKDGKEQTGVGLIAEIKRASPSKGDLALGMDILSQAKLYESGGADTISVLTETPFFKGTNQDLQVVKAVTNIPVLRKDFIIDERQIFESASIGADAILLIAAVLDGKQIEAYTKIANDLGLDVLVEVHNLEELEDVLAYSSPRLLGVNNRDLKTFQTSLSVTEQLVKHIPKDCFVVSESGIHKKQDVEQVVQAGADAMLVGEHLVTNGSPTETIPQLKEGAIHATYVKYCGLRSSEDVKNAYLSGANGLGFVFANSKRQVRAMDVAEWMKDGPYAFCETFAVLVNPIEEDVHELLETVDFDVLQFHGEETVSFIKDIQKKTEKHVVKALRHDRNTLDLMSAYAPVVDGFIVDAGTKTERGGTGQTFDWKKAPTYIHFAKQLNVPLYIAGGVHEHNVPQLLEMQPDGIDVSSGIETEGKKDDSKMKSIMRQVGDYATVLSGS